MKKSIKYILLLFALSCLMISCNGSGELGEEGASSSSLGDGFSLPDEETVVGNSNPPDGDEYAMGGTDLEAMWIFGNTKPPMFELLKEKEASSFEIHFWTKYDKEVYLSEIAIEHYPVQMPTDNQVQLKTMNHSNLISSDFHSLFDNDNQTGRAEKATQNDPFIVTFSSSTPIKLKAISVLGFDGVPEHFENMKVFAKVSGQRTLIYQASELFNDFYQLWIGGIAVKFKMANSNCPEGEMGLPNGSCTLKPTICNEVVKEFQGTQKLPCAVKVDGREVNCTGALTQSACLNALGIEMCKNYVGFLDPGPNLIQLYLNEQPIHQSVCEGRAVHVLTR